jgi:hypothetical protein
MAKNKTPLMDCGHSANATDQDGNPSCVICYMVGGEIPAPVEAPSFEGRIAKCPYATCKSERPSSTELAFFRYLPEKDYDEFYCGCHGWN